MDEKLPVPPEGAWRGEVVIPEELYLGMSRTSYLYAETLVNVKLAFTYAGERHGLLDVAGAARAELKEVGFAILRAMFNGIETPNEARALRSRPEKVTDYGKAWPEGTWSRFYLCRVAASVIHRDSCRVSDAFKAFVKGALAEFSKTLKASPLGGAAPDEELAAIADRAAGSAVADFAERMRKVVVPQIAEKSWDIATPEEVEAGRQRFICTAAKFEELTSEGRWPEDAALAAIAHADSMLPLKG